MRPPSWRLVAILATSALLAASCSGSTPARAKSHPHKHLLQKLAAGEAEIKAHEATSTTLASGTTGTGNAGSGSTTTVVTGVTTTIAAATPAVSTSTTYLPVTKKKGKRHIVTPVIERLKPNQSYTGATIMIVGKRLQHATTVAFDGIVAKVSSDSPSRIKAIVPVGATSGPISVITPNGTATIQGFSIIA